MRALTCVSVVLCVAHKPRPCLSCSRRRYRINLGLLCSYYKGWGGGSKNERHTSASSDERVACRDRRAAFIDVVFSIEDAS